MQIFDKSEELYGELAKRIDARDDAAARRLFQELLANGRSRQEIALHVSRMIENGKAGKPASSGTAETLKPYFSIGESASDDGKKPNASADTPMLKTQHRFDANSKTTFFDIGSERVVMSVPERLASKLRLQNDAKPTEAKGALFADVEAEQAVPAGLEVKHRPTPIQHGSAVSSPRLLTVRTATSAIAATLAGMFALWALYGNELEEISVAKAEHVLARLQAFRQSFSAKLDPTKPSAEPAQPEEVTVRENELSKPLETSAARPPLDDSSPQKLESTGPAVARGAATNEADARAVSTQASSDTPEKAPLQIESANPQSPQQRISSGIPQASPQQNANVVVRPPQTGATQHAAVNTVTLIAQGDQFLSKSDVASARLSYQRAAEAGDGRGALRMGMTFDPVFLARWRLRRVWADRGQAIAWYRYASALGNTEAELMQKTRSGSRFGSGAASQ